MAYINAMISCNHREYLIYVMKALTSGDTDLVSMTLYGLHRNIGRLKDPDKLFRSLIALSTEEERNNEVIVDIFVKYFGIVGNDRKYHILKDKTYSNIVVTLETYFETYRREFMIRDVVEKSFPESFQQIRKFILEKMTPELRKKTAGFLANEESRTAIRLIEDLSKWISHVTEEEQEQLRSLIEVFFDSDKKSRENSASRIEDINFEKRYLRNRIIRLCRIISRLNIQEAASPLVNIYNYLKKYPDPHLTDIIVNTLSSLNYSYMLGEIEILLFTGTEQDQLKALKLISYFTEQRSLNMLFEYLQGHVADENECVSMCIEILLDHDIGSNVTANQIFKKVIEVNKNETVRSLAVLGVGRCGLEHEVEYLNELFFTIRDSAGKDAVVRAMGEISTTNPEVKKRVVVKYLQEYLKDPGIRVRIYSCLFLIKLGDSEAIRSIREMLIIKNKGIQRDILTILGDLKSLEFSFFLISLLKEEYGMTDDIIEVLRLLPGEELKEIDGFIVNIFRKYEAPDLGENVSAEKPGIIQVKNLKREELTLLHIDISDNEESGESFTLSDMISRNIRIKSFISSAITVQDGIISLITGNRVVSFFTDPVRAIRASMAIQENIRKFNQSRRDSHRIYLYNQVITGRMAYFNEELVYYPLYMIDEMEGRPLHNRILVDGHTNELIQDTFFSKLVSELVFSDTVSVNGHFEVQNVINFRRIAEGYLERLFREREEKERMEAELEAELKNMRRGVSTPSSAAIARDLENLGNRLLENLNEIEKYVQRRSTDRELNKNVRKMLINAYNMYKVEISRLIIE